MLYSYNKVKEIVFSIIILYMPAECLVSSLWFLAVTLGLLGVLWYIGRTRDDDNRKQVSRKSYSR
jgi:hypothetical protein